MEPESARLFFSVNAVVLSDEALVTLQSTTERTKHNEPNRPQPAR